MKKALNIKTVGYSCYIEIHPDKMVDRIWYENMCVNTPLATKLEEIKGVDMVEYVYSTNFLPRIFFRIGLIEMRSYAKNEIKRRINKYFDDIERYKKENGYD
jgi:hypothetical protein